MSKKKGKTEGRKITQVYISEDGQEESSRTIAVRKDEDSLDETTVEEARHKDEHSHERKSGHESDHEPRSVLSSGVKTVRVVAIAVAMLFSMLMAMAVGVGLALWDSNRTIAELNAIVFGRSVMAATDTAGEPDGKDGSDALVADSVTAAAADEAAAPDETVTADNTEDAAENVSETVAETNEPEEEPQTGEELDGESEWNDYGYTFSADEGGSDSVAKAGSGDEISVRDDEEDDGETTDPDEDYPLPFETVDESYFTDALFIGDSRLQGFGFWSGLPATYYCATGFQLYKFDTAKVVQTENGKVPIFEALPYDMFTKIYIKVGLNELGYGTEENFENYYAMLIEKLREYEPRAIIYVHAILPVTAEKSASDKAHNNPNIIIRNQALKEFAKSQKAYFLDAGPALSTEDGSLRPEMTSDGIHLAPQYMKIWREYLCEHAVVVK